ncbi:hypothetical protein PsorP6_000188 [Peronosclerospora sorghi]|uniref:Uncharacterized protein n=1 Tax=Peronosclerospora sorghi TaxID=230839 RepID=A0ACC0WRF7_9STRA|nr:hypothetical protein PsorP6_000188 [Peronosclerospora sorghi]
MRGAVAVPLLPTKLQQDHKGVGAKIIVHTTSQEIFEGVVFTIDPVANFLVLNQTGSKSKTLIFQLEILSKIEVIEPAPASLLLTLPTISEEELQRAEQRNRGLAVRALASIGQGVSAEAQDIFDALNKT